MSIENNRILGGVGALLMFIGIFPYINYFGVIELVGLILVMVALHNLSSHYKEGSIFNNALYGLITGIVGAIISIGVIIIAVLPSLSDFLYTIFPDWNGDWTALPSLTPDMSRFSLEAITPFLMGIFAVVIIIWAFSIIAMFFFRRSLTALSTKTGVGLFSTAGLLLLIGAVLIIAFGIGLLLIWISALLLAIAFFQIKPQQPQPTTTPATPT
ncbi:MAG: DUF996 domain-containing protein [Candidatus Bathyarchaeia archaeon]